MEEDQQRQAENGQNPNGQNGESPGYHNNDDSPVQYRMNNPGWGAEFDDNFPPGYRFKPNDKELVVSYLRTKIFNEPLPQNRIKEVQLYEFNPKTLAEQYKPFDLNVWYFFTEREKKYKKGKLPKRSARDGFWKASGVDKGVVKDNVVIGFKKSLVFYTGRPPNGEKTGWMMHEFRLEGPPRIKRSTEDMRLDDMVLCRIYKKGEKDGSGHLSSRPSTSQGDDSGLNGQQADTEFHDNRAIDKGVEGSSVPPKGFFMPQDPGGSIVHDISGYEQRRFGNHNVPYSERRFNPGMPNHIVPYTQVRLNHGRPNHSVPYSQDRLNPQIPNHNVPNSQDRLDPRIPNHNFSYSQDRLNYGMSIHNVSDSQGRIYGMPSHKVSDSQGRLLGFAPYPHQNTMGQSNAWTHDMISTSNENPTQATESSLVVEKPFQAYHRRCIFDASNENLNRAAESSAAARPFQSYPQYHMLTTSNQNLNQRVESSSAGSINRSCKTIPVYGEKYEI